MKPFTLLIKPSGSDCNIDCAYCFYKDRSAELGQGKQRMSDAVLERLVADYMQLDFAVAGFAWQGGEPTLMGVDFYARAAASSLSSITAMRIAASSSSSQSGD